LYNGNKQNKMKRHRLVISGVFVLAVIMLVYCQRERSKSANEAHIFNGDYTGKYLDRVSFPIGGIGAGMFCMDGTGSFSHLSINNRPEIFNEPFSFAAISVKGLKNGAKVIEAQVPEWKMFGTPGSGKDIPMDVEVCGWSPFIPMDADNSSLPVGAMEYRFRNTSDKAIDAVFSWNSRNIISERTGRILPARNGFILTKEGPDGAPPGTTGFCASVNDDNAVVDYCWFRGAWWDPQTILWENIENCKLTDNKPVETPAPGASLYVPFTLKPGEEKLIVVNLSWYMPETRLTIGVNPAVEKLAGFYKPWYSSRFPDLSGVADYWNANYDDLRHKSELFRDAFFASTLPPEAMEAVAANLTILKSPTVLRQADGRLWGWEGCGDNEGCCHGSCTHVWNYAQAISHLFPSLERTLRETEFMVSQNAEGHQTFRSALPIAEPVHDFYAASDGQLGGIMKVYREWRISGNTEWMKGLYPLVKKSLDYCIETWDPGHKGYLEEPHHNTYDIEFWGPDGMCTSFYLGALTAIIEMSKAANEPYDKYETLLEKGKAFMESDLYDGEYFIQKVKWEGLKAPNPVESARTSLMTSYSDEALELMKREGPKYQYGTGCLSDGILGMWMATVCGLKEPLDNQKVTSHLNSVHKYNLRQVLYNHSNPQRPTYASGRDGGLLLCTWPKGGQLSLPFVYSNEVWTGIEYQVASHLMFKGEVEKGLEIVRKCRERYDGTIRNPFNEYECGNWYARAMSSYAILEGLTGVRYDAVDHTLYIDSRIGDFTSFLSTDTGFGDVGLKDGKPFMHVAYGTIDARKVIVSGAEQTLTD
jgi:uncharacterized protein (DUF608 family)